MAQFHFNAIAGEPGDVTDQVYELSLFRSVADPAPTTISLDEFLRMVSDGDAKDAIMRLRAEPDEDRQKQLKRMLPAVTVSGVFCGGHQSAHMRKHSGLLCMDFDRKDNPGMAGCAGEWRDKLAADEFVRASFLSARGEGVAAVCRVEVDRHADAFASLSEHFRTSYGLVVDKQCSDSCRLRFLSWDGGLRENVNARLFRRYSLAPKTQAADAASVEASARTMLPSRREEILSALSVLSPNERGVWQQVGMALQSEAPGLEGFNLWERWSEIADSAGKWNEQDARRVWRSFKGGGTNIETLFGLAYRAGWKGPPKVTLSGALPVVPASVWLTTEPPPVDPVLDGVFGAGEYCEVIAPSKCRKSYFVLQLALSVASGTSFLKWTLPKARKVLLVNFEVTSSWTHRRGLGMLHAMRLQAEAVDNLLVANVRGLDLPDPVGAVLETIRAYRPTLVVLDPMYMMHEGDENAAVEMVPFIRRLSSMMQETGAALLIVHHDAKGRAGDRNVRDRGSGSSIMSRYCDARIVLTPHAQCSDQVCIDLMARNYPPMEGFVARFSDDAFSVAQDAAYAPETTRNAGQVVRRSDVVHSGVQAALDRILEAGPMLGAQVEDVIREFVGKSTAVIVETKNTLGKRPELFVHRPAGKATIWGSAAWSDGWAKLGVSESLFASQSPTPSYPLLPPPRGGRVDPITYPLLNPPPPPVKGEGVGGGGFDSDSFVPDF